MHSRLLTVYACVAEGEDQEWGEEEEQTPEHLAH